MYVFVIQDCWPAVPMSFYFLAMREDQSVGEHSMTVNPGPKLQQYGMDQGKAEIVVDRSDHFTRDTANYAQSFVLILENERLNAANNHVS